MISMTTNSSTSSTPSIIDTTTIVTETYQYNADYTAFTDVLEHTNTTTTTTYALVEHGGHTIALTFSVSVTVYADTSRWHAGAPSSSYESLRWSVAGVGSNHVNRGAEGLPSDKVLIKAVKAASAAIDRFNEDEALRSSLISLVGVVPADTLPATEALPLVGKVACLFSRGTIRTGIITKVGTKNIEIAYLTRGGLDDEARGRGKAVITRKAQPIDKVSIAV
jgi:hypothetical protein